MSILFINKDLRDYNQQISLHKFKRYHGLFENSTLSNIYDGFFSAKNFNMDFRQGPKSALLWHDHGKAPYDNPKKVMSFGRTPFNQSKGVINQILLNTGFQTDVFYGFILLENFVS